MHDVLDIRGFALGRRGALRLKCHAGDRGGVARRRGAPASSRGSNARVPLSLSSLTLIADAVAGPSLPDRTHDSLKYWPLPTCLGRVPLLRQVPT